MLSLLQERRFDPCAQLSVKGRSDNLPPHLEPKLSYHEIEANAFCQRRIAHVDDCIIGAVQMASDRAAADRSEERRVVKECVSTCRSRWSPNHEHQNKNQNAEEQ